MQPPDHVDLRNPKPQSVCHSSYDLLSGMLKCVRVPLFCGKSAKLAGENADIGIVNVTIMDVGSEIAVFPFAHHAGQNAQGIEIGASIKSERVRFRDSLARLYLLRDRPEFCGN